MIVLDTSSWQNRVIRPRTPDMELTALILHGDIVTHPWVIGELLLGGLSLDRLRLVQDLASIPVAPYDVVLSFIHRFHPQGIGWVDVNLLVSAVEFSAFIITDDVGLGENAKRHHVLYEGT